MDPNNVELELGSNQDPQTKLGWSNQPREQSLVQPEITEFYNSAPTTLDRSTKHNLVTSLGLEPQRANSTSANRGSPSTSRKSSLSPDTKRKCFGEVNKVILGGDSPSPMEDLVKNYTQEAILSVVRGPAFNTYTTPSNGDSSVPDWRGEKPDRNTVAATTLSAGTDNDTSSFKKGGMCTFHRHFGRNHHVVLVASLPNFNQKFNFKLLCPLKNKNPTYGSKVTAISNKIRC